MLRTTVGCVATMDEIVDEIVDETVSVVML